jgi:hypothetical protein
MLPGAFNGVVGTLVGLSVTAIMAAITFDHDGEGGQGDLQR